MTLPAALPDNPLYMILYQLARHAPIQTILEVGSADGSGSTAILQSALQADSQLFCLEAEPDKYAALHQRYAADDRVITLPYVAVFPPRFPAWPDIVDHWQQGQSFLRHYPLGQIEGWYLGEKALASRASEVSGIAWIQKEYGIDTFDMVLLDGAEFLGEQDYQAVKGARWIVLDDIQSYKNKAVMAELLADPDYFLLYHFDRWGHGCAAFRKKITLQAGISAVIHTKNEEQNIVDCIQSLQNIASEVIVVDMYSTDQTAPLAQGLNTEKCPVRWVSHVPTSGVDIARNFGLSLAKYHWTLVLDADERLPEALQTHLLNLSASPTADAYWLARKNYFFGAWARSLFPDYQLRFFRSYGVNWGGGAHQHPYTQGSHLQVPPQFFIVHYSYQHVADFITRQEQYAQVYWDHQALSPYHLQQKLPDLRRKYQYQAEQYLQSAKYSTKDNHSWLIEHLYLFSELTQVAVAMERSGHFQAISETAPRLSAYSYLKNGVIFDYPFCESLLAVLPVCDEVVVTYAVDSEDNTFAVLQKMAQLFPHLRLYPSEVWKQQHVLQGQRIALAATEAREYCQGDWLWHVQADEVYTRQDTLKVKQLIAEYQDAPVDAFVFPIKHFYANYEQYVNEKGPQEGWYLSCIRLARRGAAEHIGDAWTQKVQDPQRLVQAPISIYHYGHVREAEAMRLKSNHMERLYKALPEDFEVCAPQSFVYDRVSQDLLAPMQSYHPEVMARRIARQRLNTLATRKQKPRLLIVSRLPGIKKGYGITFSSLYAQNVLQQHFEVHHLAWHYHGEAYVDAEVHIHPDNPKQMKDPARLESLLHALSPEVVLLHADMHFFLPYMPLLNAWKGAVVGWFTVDFEQERNPSPLVPVLQRCQRLLGMADFGLKQMRKDYPGPVGKVPLGVDTHYFHPVSYEEKIQLRRQWELPEQGVIFLTIANNFWRKGVEYAVQSFYEYCQRYPEAGAHSFLYLHTERTSELIEQISILNLQKKVLITPHYDPMKAPISTQELANLYQLSDVFLLTTLGEGFGMTLLEAQASGLPLIVSDNSVIREVTQENAFYIPCVTRVPGKTGGRMVWMKAPDPVEAAFLMHQVYQDKQMAFQMAEKALQDVRHYNWDATAHLLAGELALAVSQGTPHFDYPEPRIQAV